MISSFIYFSFPSSDMAKKKSNFKRKFSFQISKMKIFNFFILKMKIFKNFHGIFQKFPFIFWWYGQNFSNFKINFLFSFSHFPLVVWPNFSKLRNKKFQFKIQKQNFSFQIFCGINDFFLGPRLPNLLKGCQIIKRLQKLPIYPYQKGIYCISALGGMVHHKRAFLMGWIVTNL
jgi:hypothetical protein